MSGPIAPAPRFGGIIADPGWAYDQFRDSANGAAASVMETRGLRDICGVRAGQRWADDPCVLVLWGTGPKIDQAVFVERAWGFQHKTMVPWLKTAPKREQLARGGIGIWVEAKAEYVLFAERGSLGGFYSVKDTGKKHLSGKRAGKRVMEFTRLRPRPEGCLVGPREYPVFWNPDIEEDPDWWNALTPQALLAPRVRAAPGEVNHSKKPLALYEYLETFPGELLELYARREPVALFDEGRRKRWTCWGWDTGVELGAHGVRPRPTVGGMF